MSYLFELIDKELDGDDSWILELFRDESVFDALIAQGKDSDWYHFEPKTFDGEYFVKTGSSYACYLQERGAKSQYMTFNSLQAAAEHFFKQAGFLKSPESSNGRKHWWEFWK